MMHIIERCVCVNGSRVDLSQPEFKHGVGRWNCHPVRYFGGSAMRQFPRRIDGWHLQHFVYREVEISLPKQGRVLSLFS